MGSSKQQFLDNIPIFSETSSSKHHKLVVNILLARYFQLGSDQISLFLQPAQIINHVIVTISHMSKFLQLVVNYTFLHIQIPNIIDLLLIYVLLHPTNRQLFLPSTQ